MVLPSLKIDKLLELFNSSEDELDEVNDEEEETEEKHVEQHYTKKTDNISQKATKPKKQKRKLRKTKRKAAKSVDNTSINDEIKVVELEVEPIVIVDSEIESEDNKKVRRKRKKRKISGNSSDGSEGTNTKKHKEENCEAKVKRHVSKYSPRIGKNRPRVDRNLKCKKCDQRMKNEQLFMLHMQIHNKRKETECVICNLDFENVNAVLEHYASFDKNKENEHYIKIRPFSCHLCSFRVARYKNRRDLLDHLDIHAGKKKYLCPLCGKQFAKRFNMMTHIKVHEKSPHRCDRCNQRFRNIREYETHQRMIHGENKLVCDVCNKTFCRRDNLKAHLDTHDNQCILCNSNFDTRRDLNQHMREVHNRIKKHTCSFCGKVFLLRYNYTKHLESHNRIKDTCTSCEKEFRNYRDYGAHMRNIHGVIIDIPKFNEHTCPVCNRGFSRRDNMKTHMKTHFKWKCTLCNTNFEFRKDLNQHMGEIHNRIKKYTCSICGKVFLLHCELTKHIETHNSDKNNCTICDKEFKNRRDFNAHMKNMHGEIVNLPKKNIKANQPVKCDLK